MLRFGSGPGEGLGLGRVLLAPALPIARGKQIREVCQEEGDDLACGPTGCFGVHRPMDRRARWGLLHDDEQIPPGQAFSAEPVQTQSEGQQVVFNGLAVLP